MKVKLQLPGVKQLIRQKGFDASGHVQKFHTQNVLKRIKRYMPFRAGATYKITVAQTNIDKPEIVTDVPYAKYLYYGKVMVDPKLGIAGFMTPEGWRSRKDITKVLTDRNIQYTKTKNPNAGPYWDRTLCAFEGKAMIADLQRYINRR